MSDIGEFTINALEKMCSECPNPKIQLDSYSYETFEFGEEFHYRLYCENANQCKYALSVGLQSANISCPVVKE